MNTSEERTKLEVIQEVTPNSVLRQLSLSVALVLAVSSPVKAIEKKPGRAPTPGEIQAVTAALKATLTDPQSLQVKEWLAQVDGAVLCGLYNGKNQTGGYASFRPFVAVYSEALSKARSGHKAEVVATGFNASTLCFRAISDYQGWNPL